jgi:hypothetical protein
MPARHLVTTEQYSADLQLYVTQSLFRVRSLSKASFRLATSPSANQRLAFTIWITLMICFPTMTGALMPTRIHGTVESILFARAISNAPALQGLTKMLGWAGEPGWAEVPVLLPEASVMRREGERSGEEKERR